MRTSPKDNPGVFALPPLIFGTTVVIGGLLHLVFPVRLLPPIPARIAGTMTACLAGVLAVWAVRVMKTAGTNIRPDRPVTTIVTAGPYRFSRNPMYVSLCALQVGIALLIDGLMPLILVIPLVLVLHFGVIRREEIYLATKFGEDYLSFKNRVRRWL